jgi:dihydrolipoyl dehydrogenase
MLIAVGMKPNSDGLGLDKVGVQLDPKGFVKVDAQLRTSVPSIFAIGDLIGAPLLAHKASKEGLVAASVIAGSNDRYDVRAMPAAIFTDPEIATVGLNEAEAKQKGLEVKIGTFPFSASGRALTTGHADGLVKIVADAKTDQILGVGIAGPDASDLIAEAALGIELGATSEDLALTVHAHPTLAETMMEAAEAVHGMAIHAIGK